MDEITCEDVVIELDDFSKLLHDQIIVMASLLGYDIVENSDSMGNDNFKCSFYFIYNKATKFTLAMQVEGVKLIEIRLYKHILRSISLLKIGGPFKTFEKLLELL